MHSWPAEFLERAKVELYCHSAPLPPSLVSFVWLNSYRSFISGHAYRYCGADGNWQLVPNMNKTWANYTECALFFAPERQNQEKVKHRNTINRGERNGEAEKKWRLAALRELILAGFLRAVVPKK